LSSCEVCGFELWEVYGELVVSDIGLYSDARFPGRSILRLKDHYDRLEDLPENLAFDFVKDIQTASKLLRETTGAERVNVAILGNTEAHVHAHLIPRWPLKEAKPGSSPWDDPRPREALEKTTMQELLRRLRESFTR
jgi:diadenosine tetraphosphate (Ap4A) HIT family hydrolase